jgi:fumarate reductase subunit C
MTEQPAPRSVAPDYRLQWYRPRMSTWWWLRKRSYLLFILRELSSVFVAWTVVFLLMLIWAVGRGEREYADFLDWASAPWVVGLNVITLAFLVYHAVTWFNLTPKAMVLKVRGRSVPAALIAASAFAGWAVVSVVVAAFVLGS